MIDLHFKDFDDVAGDTDVAKYQTLIDQSPTRFIVGMNKFNGVFCEYDARERCFKTKRNMTWREGFFPARMVEEVAELASFLAGNLNRPVNIWGELWMPDTPLATLAGAVSVNRTQLEPSACSMLSYRIFDIYDPLGLAINFPFWVRAEALHAWENADNDFAFRVPAGQFGDAANAAEAYNYISQRQSGFEGMVYYVGRATQLPGVSHEIIKRTVTHTAEFPCIGVEHGLPDTKRAGRISALVLRDTYGNTFRVGGGVGMTQELLQRFAERPPLGKQIMISFKEYSVNNIPLRPKFLAVRDYE